MGTFKHGEKLRVRIHVTEESSTQAGGKQVQHTVARRAVVKDLQQPGSMRVDSFLPKGTGHVAARWGHVDYVNTVE